MSVLPTTGQNETTNMLFSHFFQSLFHISNIVKIPLLCQRLPDDVFLKLCFDIVMAAFSVIVHEGVSLEIFIDKLNAEQGRNDL